MAKTIVEKLNLKKYQKIAVLNLPEETNYLAELENYETALVSGNGYDLIFAFVLDIESFQTMVHKVIQENFLSKNGYLYLAYPKKGNKVYPTFIHRDELFESVGVKEDGFIGTSSIKFARMVGLDEVFTVVGLKEESKTKNQTSSKSSQSVQDYVEYVTKIESDLEEDPKLLQFFQSLTPGYQKDWARYVYSAKQDATKEKRRLEMKSILGAGHKNRDSYMRSKS
jgi:hypothetical protein